jgi:actin
MELVRSIKENLCFVAPDYTAALKEAAKHPSSFDKEFVLPDGKSIVLGDQRFKCAEALFHPTLIGQDVIGLSELLSSSIQKCAIDTR